MLIIYARCNLMTNLKKFYSFLAPAILSLMEKNVAFYADSGNLKLKSENPFKWVGFSSDTVAPAMDNVSRQRFRTSIHIMALDGIVNVNSLFTFAVFLGLAWYPTTNPAVTLASAADPACIADTAMGESLIEFHVYSFSSFLFSSLIACALKQALRIRHGDGDGELRSFPMAIHVNAAALRGGILVSAAGSVFGCVFLMLALVDLVQIKLGTLACRSWDSLAAIGPLVILVPFALVVFVGLVLYAFIR